MNIPTKYINIKLHGVLLMEEMINRSRLWHIEQCEESIDGAINKKFYCVDIDAYVKSINSYKDDLLNWNFAVTNTFLQRAYYFQTGLNFDSPFHPNYFKNISKRTLQ